MDFIYLLFQNNYRYLFQISEKTSKIEYGVINNVDKRGLNNMKIQEIREIIKLIDQSSLDEFLYESEGTKIKLKKNEKGSVNSIE